jgi:Phage integrase family
MIRVETAFTGGEPPTPKGKRARSTPLVPVLAERLAALSARARSTRADDYVFSDHLGDRISDKTLRTVFYAALARAALGDKRAAQHVHGNPQTPMRLYDLRHSWCTWAVTSGRSPRCRYMQVTATSRRRCGTCTIRLRQRTPAWAVPTWTMGSVARQPRVRFAPAASARSTSLRTNRTCLPIRMHGRRPSRAYWSTVFPGTFPRRAPTCAAVRSGSSRRGESSDIVCFKPLSRHRRQRDRRHDQLAREPTSCRSA